MSLAVSVLNVGVRQQTADFARCGSTIKHVCPVLFSAASVDGQEVTTLEGLQEEAAEFGRFLAEEGAEQCGFCSPGFIMSVLAMVRELDDPTVEEMKEYLAGNLCRCTGYMGQLRAIRKYMKAKRMQFQTAGEEARA